MFWFINLTNSQLSLDIIHFLEHRTQKEEIHLEWGSLSPVSLDASVPMRLGNYTALSLVDGSYSPLSPQHLTHNW